MSKDIILNTAEDVDLAAFDYLRGATRSRAEFLVSALLRCYPSLRGELVFTYAWMKTLGTSQPPVHHAPLPWLVAVDMAHWLTMAGFHRRAALLLLGWRFGLRPSELVALRGADVYAPSRMLYPSNGFLRLGTGPRGTKAGRPQVVRALKEDLQAQSLLEFFAGSTPPNAQLTDLLTYRALHNCVKTAVVATNHLVAFSPHSARAGWASARFAAGQPFTELQEDGRWRSPAALRIYLDAVAAADYLGTPAVVHRVPRLQLLEATLASWLFQ